MSNEKQNEDSIKREGEAETIKDFNTLIFEKENEIIRLQNALRDAEIEKEKLIHVIVLLAKKERKIKSAP